MSKTPWHTRQRVAFTGLVELICHRTHRGEEMAESYRDGVEQAERENRRAQKQIDKQRGLQLTEIEQEWEQTRARIDFEREAAIEAVHAFGKEGRRELLRHHETNLDKLRTEFQDALWTLDSLLEAGEKRAKEKREKLRRELAALNERADQLVKSVEPMLTQLRLSMPEPTDPDALTSDDGITLNLSAAMREAGETANRLRSLKLARISSWKGWSIILVVLVGLGVGVGYSLSELNGLGFGVAAGLIAALFCRLGLRIWARTSGGLLAQSLADQLSLSEQLRIAMAEKADRTFVARIDELRRQHREQRESTENTYQPQIDQAEQDRLDGLAKHDDEYNRRLESTREQYQITFREAETTHETRRSQAVNDLNARSQQAQQVCDSRTEELLFERERGETELWRHWSERSAAIRAELRWLSDVSERHFPDWDSTETAALSIEVPGGVRFGEYVIDWAHLGAGPQTGGLPWDGDPKKVPALLPFPLESAVLIRAGEKGRSDAVATLQAMMLRFLTGLPPGQVRFTLCDPVGRGDSFAGFMHLTDFDELMVNHRIWTEAVQIDQRLADLTEHMEMVIQKYLRNQFRTIEEYNEAAGEVAEPFRVLVVSDFPVNFTPEAARRLVSLAVSGPTCGIAVLVSADPKSPMPHGFRMEELEEACFPLAWRDGEIIPTAEPFKAFPLKLDRPPESEQLVRIVRRVGELGRDAKRVEVPFDFIAPEPGHIWTSTSRTGLSIPLGRSGATKRLPLELGKGTAQHTLIAGKTGSGKSTLLHALITSAALHFSPDELEMYLIDFKKGVEFKQYATLGLPHARVIAVESDREFGLSALQRLDAELRDRGERFRAVGAQDVASFRETSPDELCPRILLVVDEFQEFFVEEDKLAQEAALLLDRLVRQGRAFGLHVVLGSQTLGGAYSLARSTVDQMGVRIALQCSEADAQLILNKDNSAARLLNRPGEAIYNAAGGATEGNDIFQVVWLSDKQREAWLRKLDGRSYRSVTRQPIIFEGGAGADAEENPLLEALLQANEWPTDTRAGTAWLGDAIAIKDPTAAIFAPQSGRNLLIIGQNEDSALSMLAVSLIGLAAQHAPGSANFDVLDGTPLDDSRTGILRDVSDRLPHRPRWIERTELATWLGGLKDELTRRQESGDANPKPHYVILQGLHRYRDLRRDEDDYGFGRAEEAKPEATFRELIREGSALGIHFLMWCDGLTNVNRAFDRNTLRECALRVLFQMSQADSSHLIDTPIASRLGRNRALFHDEETGYVEKFRPYELPTASWLSVVAERLGSRSVE